MVLASHTTLAAARQAAHDLVGKLLRLIPLRGPRTSQRDGETQPPRPESLMEDGWEPAETLQRDQAQSGGTCRRTAMPAKWKTATRLNALAAAGTAGEPPEEGPRAASCQRSRVFS